jgi:hypothetical protein
MLKIFDNQKKKERKEKERRKWERLLKLSFNYLLFKNIFFSIRFQKEKKLSQIRFRSFLLERKKFFQHLSPRKKNKDQRSSKGKQRERKKKQDLRNHKK